MFAGTLHGAAAKRGWLLVGTWRLLLIPLLIVSSLLVACSGSKLEAPASAPPAAPAEEPAPKQDALAAISTPTALQEVLIAALTAMSEEKWADARQHMAVSSLKDEAIASKWKSILSMEYGGDPKQIRGTQVLSVMRNGDRANLKLRTPVSGIKGKATMLLRDGKWYILDFGDTAFE